MSDGAAWPRLGIDSGVVGGVELYGAGRGIEEISSYGSRGGPRSQVAVVLEKSLDEVGIAQNRKSDIAQLELYGLFPAILVSRQSAYRCVLGRVG